MKSNTLELEKALLLTSLALLFVVTTIFASSGDRNYKGYTVYNPQASTVENYYVHTGFSMPEGDFTVCLWWRLLTPSSTYTCLTSISVEDEDDLHSVRVKASSGHVMMQIISADGTALGELSSNVNIFDWTYTCTTSMFSPSASDGKTELNMKVYNLYGLDAVWSETLEFSNSGLSGFVKPSVDGGAGVALFQDQDVVGGGFVANQASDGWRACLNIWRGTFSADELLRFSDCEERGDVFSMSDNVGEIVGDVTDYCVTPRIDGASAEQLIRDTDSAYFCVIKAKILSGLTLQNVKTTSQLSCAAMCTSTDDCYSANFYPASGMCELGARGESLQPERLVTSTDGVHISFLFCGC